MIKRFMLKLFSEQKFFRRTILMWAMVMFTHWSIFLMDNELLINIGAAGAAVVSTVFTILTAIISFYQWHRKQDDERDVKETDQSGEE